MTGSVAPDPTPSTPDAHRIRAGSRGLAVRPGLALLLLLASVPVHAIATRSETRLSQTRVVPPKLEWTREFFVRAPETLRCAVTSGGAFAVSVLAERAYLAIKSDRPDDMHREDVLVSEDRAPGRFERDVPFAWPGSYWFVIGNRSGTDQEISLSCTARVPTGGSPHRRKRPNRRSK